MAGQLKEVRNRIKSVQSTQQITKAMKMVSAAKLAPCTGCNYSNASLCKQDAGNAQQYREQCRRRSRNSTWHQKDQLKKYC